MRAVPPHTTTVDYLLPTAYGQGHTATMPAAAAISVAAAQQAAAAVTRAPLYRCTD
jgi:hypothetical protein